MKKNILTVVILALTTINLVLTALIVFLAIPNFTKSNKLITQVASVLDFELQGGNNTSDRISIEDSVPYPIEKELQMNLKKSEDGNEYYAMLDSFSLTVNKASEDYSKLKDSITTNQITIIDILQDTFLRYTKDELQISSEAIKIDILEQLKDYFKSDFIVDISFSNLRFS